MERALGWLKGRDARHDERLDRATKLEERGKTQRTRMNAVKPFVVVFFRVVPRRAEGAQRPPRSLSRGVDTQRNRRVMTPNPKLATSLESPTGV